MGRAIQWVRSVLFVGQMYLMMAIIGIGFFPFALLHRNGARIACKAFCYWVLWTARWMVGIRTEIRGTVPTDQVVVAAKHQSFLDIIMIFAALPAAKFIMKRELLYTPFLGQYAWRLGCIPVDRGKRGQAIQKMVKDVERGASKPGQLIIYPQGTRVPPGQHKPYKVGSAVLYSELNQDCVPAATNVGLFWPRRSMYRTPGLAVVEFLPRLEKGLAHREFLKRLEDEVETGSDQLMAEAGHKAPQ